jgi:hypothetical protein
LGPTRTELKRVTSGGRSRNCLLSKTEEEGWGRVVARLDRKRLGQDILRSKWNSIRGVRDYDGPALDMGDGEIVTPEHLVLHDGQWVRVDSLGWFLETQYKGTIHNLHIDADASDDQMSPTTEHSYILSNGLIAHNVET